MLVVIIDIIGALLWEEADSFALPGCIAVPSPSLPL